MSFIQSHQRYGAAIAWTCAQYRHEVAADTGRLSLAVPADVAGENFDRLDEKFQADVREECGTEIDVLDQRWSSAVATPPPLDASDGGVDNSLERALQEADVDAIEIRRLGFVAYQTGYIFRSNYPDEESLKSFALMAVLECRDVAAGKKTWETSRSEAMSTGASLGEASRMTHYLESSFCPGVR